MKTNTFMEYGSIVEFGSMEDEKKVEITDMGVFWNGWVSVCVNVCVCVNVSVCVCVGGYLLNG